MTDLYDISHHNTIIDWGRVEQIPIVHKVNEGTRIDSAFASRMPTISARTEIFGGYTVLIVAASSIRRQVETYAGRMEPFWRDGAFTQLDVEPWETYTRPVNCDEIEEAQQVHDELLGAGRLTVYINPNQMPATFEQWADRNPGRPLWLPNYSRNGDQAAERLGATIHQYTSRHPAPGFTAGIDANRVLDWDALKIVCNLRTTPTPTPTPIPEDDDDMQILINDTQLNAVFTIDGIPVSPEVIEAMTVNAVPHVIVDQDHEYWRAAVSARIGALAGFRYGQRHAQRDTP